MEWMPENGSTYARNTVTGELGGGIRERPGYHTPVAIAKNRNGKGWIV